MHMTDIPTLHKPASTDDRSIGAILIDSGLLRADDADRIIIRQREAGLRFGEAAIELGLVSDADLRFALSSQFEYLYLKPGSSPVSPEVLAAYQPFRREVEAMRAIRSQLMMRWLTGAADRHLLAIVGTGRGDGRSWVAANLAVVFSQLGERTLLIDADLRHPRQHTLFGLENRVGLSSLLSGKEESEAVQDVGGLRQLSVLTAGAVPPNPQELLGRPAFGEQLRQFAGQFDVVLVDSPAADDYADVQTIAGRCGGALVVARESASRFKGCLALVESIRASGATVVGATYTGA